MQFIDMRAVFNICVFSLAEGQFLVFFDIPIQLNDTT